MTIPKHKKIYAITAVSFLILGTALGIFYERSHLPKANISVREKNDQYKFISPLLFTDNMNPDTKDHKALNSSLNSYIKDAIAKKQADKVSVYFRDLNTGRWLGINENDQYEPASLLKITLLITYLREAEINPGILDEQLKTSPDSHDFDTTQNYKPKNPIKIGKAYTIRDLLSSMIIDSDNNAVAMLTQNIPPATLDDLYSDLQIPASDGTTNNISPALYSRFFRILYNSSYLSHPASEAVLSLLSKTDFSPGLVAGVPQGTVVSHKFGERVEDIAESGTSTASSTSKQLHDCGIVYYPKNPYFICVMTKGQSFDGLEKTISSISKIVWDDVDNVNSASDQN